jgi:hypothetical protein
VPHFVQIFFALQEFIEKYAGASSWARNLFLREKLSTVYTTTQKTGGD